MADLNQLYDALRKADAAGNAEDAKKLADAIRQQSPARRTPMQMFATEALKGFAQGGLPGAVVRPALKAAAEANKAFERGVYDVGGRVTDVASMAGMSPERAGFEGAAANVGLNAIPMLLGGEVGKVAGKMAEVPLQSIGRQWMQQAVKPTLDQLKTGEAATAIDTMLKEGVNPTPGGVEKLRDMVDKLNVQIKDVIGTSTETVNKGKVGTSLIDTFNKFKEQVNPKSDLDAIRKAWIEFRSHPDLIGKTEIPVQKAQSLKQGTYRILRDKYGQLGSAETEAQKGLARGLKEGIAQKIPQITGLNAEESKLITTLNVAERRALMSLNNNIGGLAWLTTDPKKFAAFIADRSPLFKSLAARMVYSTGKASGAVGQAAGRTGVALAEFGHDMGP